jgi:putative transposase
MNEVMTSFGLSQRRMSRLTGWNRSSLQYTCRERSDTALRERLKHWAALKPRWGAPILHDVLRAEGLVLNHKRTERLYREEGLSLRRKTRRKLPAAARVPLPQASGPNQRWSMDFVHDQLSDGRRFRSLTIVDEFTRQCLAITVDHSIGGTGVVRTLEQLLGGRSKPSLLITDNGPEFTSRALHQWAQTHGINLHHIQPGKPTQNAFIESFNGTFRDDCLNQHWFSSLAEARLLIEHWRKEYNSLRPHSSIGRIPPDAFALHHSKTTSNQPNLYPEAA